MGEPRARNVTISDQTIHVIERPAEEEDLGPYTFPGTQYEAVDLDKDQIPDLFCEALTFYEPPNKTHSISSNDKGCVIFNEKYRSQAKNYLSSRPLAKDLGNEDQRKMSNRMFENVVAGALALFDRFKAAVEEGKIEMGGFSMGKPAAKILFESKDVYLGRPNEPYVPVASKEYKSKPIDSVTMFAHRAGDEFQYTGYHLHSLRSLLPIQSQLKLLDERRIELARTLHGGGGCGGGCSTSIVNSNSSNVLWNDIMTFFRRR